jgi:DNA-binding NarL/FixJ family response regulator
VDSLVRSPEAIRVLVVDDHAAVRVGLRKTLGHDGIQVVGDAGDGSAALQALEATRPDVALVDMLLPLESGTEVTRLLLQKRPTLKVIAFSMREERWLVRAALDAGARGFVFKRSPQAHWSRAVRQVLAGQLYVDEPLEPTWDYEAPAPQLSAREAEVLRLLAQGLSRQEAAQRLQIGARTLETYRERGMHKLQLRTREDLMRFAIHAGWLSDGEEPHSSS